MTEITSEMLANLKAKNLKAAQDIKDTDYTDDNTDPDEILELIAEVERLRAERQKIIDTLGSAVAFVRDWQLCELRHMSDAPSARAACALEQAFRLLGVQTEPPEQKS